MLEKKIQEDARAALRAGQEMRLGVLRMLSAALHNRRIEKRSRGGQDLTDEDALAVLRSEVKKRHEAIREFTAGDRRDLADREAEELALLQAYLPPEMSDAEIERVVREVVAAFGGSTPGDFGRVMGAVMKQVGQAASGNRVAEALRRVLAESFSHGA